MTVVGDTIEITGSFIVQHTGQHADPATLTLAVRTPGSVTSIYTYDPAGGYIIRDTTGVYRAVIDVTEIGLWAYEWTATGLAAGVELGHFLVDPSISTTSSYDAMVAGVGTLLRARTRTDFESGGREVGTFTEQTTPTHFQVVELLGQAASEIAADLGARDSLPASVLPLFDALTKLRAAMFVELSYFPESVASGTSPYDQLERMYDKRLMAAEKAVEQAGAGDLPGSADDALLPVFSFPAAPSGDLDPAPSWWGGW